MEAIRIIKDEHRSLGAVLHGMLYLVHRTRDRGDKPNFDLLGAMVYCIDAFPSAFIIRREDRVSLSAVANPISGFCRGSRSG